jgi:uncharacterized protein (DUF2132 family)
MNEKAIYENNPLHGLKLEILLAELVDHYGWEILYAYLNLKCFDKNPSVESSLKFLRKTSWAQEKVDAFYMYQFKSLPRASNAQFELPPRDRIVPAGDTPGEPAELSFEDAEQLKAKRARKAKERDEAKRSGGGGNRGVAGRSRSYSHSAPTQRDDDPWGLKKKQPEQKQEQKSEEKQGQKSERDPNPWGN